MKSKAKPKIHQLTNMEIHEVSLVDHAANKRRFLIAKRSDELPQDEDTESPTSPAKPPAAEATAANVEPAPDPAAETNALLRELLVAVKEGGRSGAGAANEDQPPSTPKPDAGEDTAVEKAINQRLVRLEKYFGLPNSEAPDAQSQRRTPHSWPFDINRPGTPEDGGNGQEAE